MKTGSKVKRHEVTQGELGATHCPTQRRSRGPGSQLRFNEAARRILPPAGERSASVYAAARRAGIARDGSGSADGSEGGSQPGSQGGQARCQVVTHPMTQAVTQFGSRNQLKCTADRTTPRCDEASESRVRWDPTPLSQRPDRGVGSHLGDRSVKKRGGQFVG